MTNQYILTLLAAILWCTIWELIALWRAGRNNQKGWFIFMAFFNMMGLVPIGYLLWGQRDKNEIPKVKVPAKNKRK